MKRALIVDDKAENLYYLQALLAGHGYAVDSARHGVEALATARRTPPSIVVSDLLMPVMDGYTLLRHWKEDPALKQIPFIVYTATYTSVEDERLALDLGADAFILKPAEPEDFMARIRSIESGVSGTAAAAPRGVVADEGALTRKYGEAVVRKLEKKIAQQEATRRALEHEVVVRQEMAEMQRAILDALPALVALLDASGNILALNEAWRLSAVACGLTRSMLEVGVNYFAICEAAEAEAVDDDRQIAARGIRRVIAGELPQFSMEYRCHSPADQRWFRLITTPMRRGGSGGAVIMYLDITERLLLEKQLAQAQKMEAVGQLTGGVAHDFNNLLGVVLGNLELLDENLADRPELSALLQSAIQATERGASLTRSLLAFSLQQALESRPIDASSMLREMTDLLRRTVRETIDIAFVPGTNHLCDADPGQFQSAVLNLVLNARDAMPDGGRIGLETADVVLGAAARAGVTPGEYVVVAVSDTGIGMAPDVIARAFDPFFTTKEVGKGSGLGLSMVYGFAKQSRGHVEIESRPGRGTTVRIYLPRSSTGTASPPSPMTESEQSGRGETILVVEDDKDLRALTSGLLRSLGYAVVAADRASMALDLLRRDQRIAVVLTDMVLPGGTSGRELAEAARRLCPAVKIVYMSGYAVKEIIHDGRLDPGVQLLEKPFTKRALAAKIRTVLEQETAR